MLILHFECSYSEGMLILKSDDSEENSASCQKMQISKLQTVNKGTSGLEGQNEETDPT